MKIHMDGKLVPERDAKVSVFDHGLLYGDGVFEGIRVYNGRVFKLAEHLERLFDSAKAIRLVIPVTMKKLEGQVLETCRANRLRDGYIRLVVTRGKGNLGLNPFTCKRACVIIIAATIQLYPQELYETGMSVITVPTPRTANEAMNPRIKSLNYLNNILAKIEGMDSGAPEAIMLNSLGQVAEATGDNVFVIRKGVLRTPPAWCGILEGITRNTVLDLAREAGVPTREEPLSRYDLYTADEMFLTGSAAEIISVTRVDGRAIGAGRPGPMTRRLARTFSAYARSCGAEIYA